MATKDSKTASAAAAITKSDETQATGTALVASSNAELAAALEGVDFGDGGLGEVGNEDIKIAAKVFNMKGVDPKGDPIPPNVFFDTVQETTDKELDLVLLDLHKTNEWREFDAATQKSITHCRSQDQITGKMADDTLRPCKDCPDAKWSTDPSTGKRGRRCGPVYNMIAADAKTGDPCVVRFKKTALPVIQQHLNKHHIGKLQIAPGRRGNVPLFAMVARMSLKMVGTTTKYAIPVIERGRILRNDEVAAHAASAKFYREAVLPMLDKLGEKDAGGDEGGDTSFNPSDFGGDPMPAARPGGDRFADDGLR